MHRDISGVIPSVLVPFDSKQEIHEETLFEYSRRLAERKRVGGLLCNGHAGERDALTASERASVVKTVASAADDKPVISGVVGGSTEQLIEDAYSVVDAGADAIMVGSTTTQINNRPEAAKQFFQRVSDEVEMPIVLFQLAVRSGMNYDPALLAELAQLDNVVAIKEGAWDVDHTQDDVRAVRESGADVNYLMGNDEHLLPCYALGVDGTVVELGAAFPDLVIGLYDAVQNDNLEEARAIKQRMDPLLDAVYQEPLHDSSFRLKVALTIMGTFPTSMPHEPAVPIPDDEVSDIKQAIEEADIE